jgi:hypothetical protein
MRCDAARVAGKESAVASSCVGLYLLSSFFLLASIIQILPFVSHASTVGIAVVAEEGVRRTKK